MSFVRVTFAVAAAIFFLLSSAGSALAASQTWYLDAENSLVASREDTTGTVDDVRVYANSVQTWWANEAALVEVNFGTGDFTYSITLTAAYTGTYVMTVGSGMGGAFAGMTFSSAPTTVSGVTTLTGTIPVANFVVPAGETLGFEIANLDGSTRMDVAVGGGQSSFTSTNDDPGYPTPELTTVLLAGAGLGLVAVAVSFGRRS